MNTACGFARNPSHSSHSSPRSPLGRGQTSLLFLQTFPIVPEKKPTGIQKNPAKSIGVLNSPNRSECSSESLDFFAENYFFLKDCFDKKSASCI
jgi:hypothetical protein